MNKLEIEYVDINSIRPYENNAKLHPKEQIEQIKKSIEQFGMDDPIGIWKDEIVEGHGRLMACQELGYTEVPIIRLDHLTDEERKAYTLAHNKLTMNSDFNLDILENELKSITSLNMEDFGFDIDLDMSQEQEIVEDDYELDENIPEEPKAKLGDIYQLGQHRLMCGDSTKEEDVDKLMNGKTIQLIVTDPPYKLTARGSSGTMGGYWKGIKAKKGTVFDNNNISFNDYINELYRVLKDDSILYIMCNNKNLRELLNVSIDAGFKFVKNLIWEKGNKICGKYYMGCYEYIVLFRKGKDRQINNCGTPDILKIPIKKLKDTKGNNLHDTEKPVELMKMLIDNSSTPEETVLDPFMGIGSTGVACKELNRNFIGIEIDEEYYNIAKERIETV